jgi:hypothetical protein
MVTFLERFHDGKRKHSEFNESDCNNVLGLITIEWTRMNALFDERGNTSHQSSE